ncbi:type IV toxin-antitoxin system AbiEi family antitoxin domain-containing protein [Microbacterium sp.]|uniref:type IV toxin-antitoxin system AbiEi family antitoxin domain-containing protein n=1 Tax=Microbacterium sp. TaxID=51671 RepID=UPI003F6E98A0
MLGRADLHALGISDHAMDRLVREGVLVRARRGAYLRADSTRSVVDAVRVGGRLCCVSELARAGVFVHVVPRELHVHVPGNAARLRGGIAARIHWAPLARQPRPGDGAVEIMDALVQSAACQEPRSLVASFDSALQRGLLRPDDVEDAFRLLPTRLRRWRDRLDGRAESGPESLVRLMLHELGHQAEVQVRIAGVGRVDLVVDGWLVIECDSQAYHGSWDARRRDVRRDQELAAQGYVVFRPIAEDILYRPAALRAALAGLLARAPKRRAR